MACVEERISEAHVLGGPILKDLSILVLAVSPWLLYVACVPCILRKLQDLHREAHLLTEVPSREKEHLHVVLEVEPRGEREEQ